MTTMFSAAVVVLFLVSAVAPVADGRCSPILFLAAQRTQKPAPWQQRTVGMPTIILPILPAEFKEKVNGENVS
jgi:hypothetical protein